MKVIVQKFLVMGFIIVVSFLTNHTFAGNTENNLTDCEPSYYYQFHIIENEEHKKYDDVSGIIYTENGDTYYKAVENGEMFVVKNSEEKEKYDVIYDLVANENHYAYIAKNGNKEFVVFDGVEQKKYDNIKNEVMCSGELYQEGLFLIDDTVAYKVIDGDKIFFVINEEEQNIYDDISSYVSSSENGDIYYMAKENNDVFYVINGIEQYKFDSLSVFGSPPLTSDNSGLFVYTGVKNEKQYLVINEKISRGFDSIQSYDISPNFQDIFTYAVDNNTHYILQNTEVLYEVNGTIESFYEEYIEKYGKTVFTIRDDEGEYLFIDGEVKSKKYDELGRIEVLENGEIIFKAKENEKWFVVVNGEKQKLEHDFIWNLGFTSSGDIYYIADNNGQRKNQFIFNNEIQREYDEIWQDSLHYGRAENIDLQDMIVYRARDEGKELMVINNIEGKRYDEINRYDIYVTDQKQVVYRATEDGKDFIVINTDEQEKHNTINDLKVFENGKIVYTVTKNKQVFIVEDGVPHLEIFDDIRFSQIRLNERGELVYIAEKNNKRVYVIDGKIQEKYANDHSYFVDGYEGEKLAYSVSVDYPFPKDTPFFDKDGKNPHKKEITYLYSLGIVEGYKDGTYRPYNAINRGEFLKIVLLSQYSEEEIIDATLNIKESFIDISDEDWIFPYAEFALQKGIISGYSDDSFRHYSEINFAEASKIIVETLLDKSFEDSVLTELWYTPYIRALNTEASELGIYGELDPFHLITRGQMAEYIYWIHH